MAVFPPSARRARCPSGRLRRACWRPWPRTTLRGSWGGPILWGGGSYRIRILMYRDVSCMYPVEYMYPECILTFCTYPKGVQDTFGIHIRYIKIRVSCASNLMRFLDVTLDTYQDTSGYMYLGLFITIHQDTPRYKITIHVSWTRHGAGNLAWAH